MLSRRKLQKSTLALAGIGYFYTHLLANSTSGIKARTRFHMGACIWSIRKANQEENL
jgi:hypothetical protein